MRVRRETAADVAAVRELTAAAFAGLRENAGRDVPVEVPLLDALRDCDEWIPELSLVAESAEDAEGTEGQGRLRGHVVCTRGYVGAAPALGLGPISVHPDHQGRGVGSALMYAVLAAAEARGETLVALLGEPAFYARFGFRPADRDGVGSPDPAWGDYFRTRVLTADGPAPQGEFRYARPFREL